MSTLCDKNKEIGEIAHNQFLLIRLMIIKPKGTQGNLGKKMKLSTSTFVDFFLCVDIDGFFDLINNISRIKEAMCFRRK